LEELFSSGFGAIMDIGTNADDLGERVRAFSRFPGVSFSAGIWPSAEAIRDRTALLKLLTDNIARDGAGRVVAIGECGFDRHWNKTEEGADTEGERELFAEQAKLAFGFNLPLVVHSREAADETARAIESIPGLRGVIHCFSYGKDEARRFLDLGFHLSFAGTITYKNSSDQREAARFAPDDRLLLETDSPYLAPLPFRGKSAEPGMVERTYEAVATLRGITVMRLTEIAAKNAHDLFGFPKRF